VEHRRIVLPLLAFVLLVTVLAFTHDVWRDEVRAFSVATRPETWRAMLEALHEEGHPALWYVILRTGYLLTDSPYVMQVVAAVIGIVTAWVILRYAPFTPAVRLLAVFGAFLTYELTVVARNYGIGVLLILGACAMFERRRERPWRLAIVLALAANTSVHAAVAAALITSLWIFDLVRFRGTTGVIVQAAAPVILILAGIGFAFATAAAPPDMAYAFSLSSLTPQSIARAILMDPGHSLRGTGEASLVASGEIPWERLRLDTTIVSRMLVNLAIGFVGWGLRRSKIHLAVFIVGVLAFELVFRIVYPGALRHQALLAFLIFGICWLAVIATNPSERRAAARRVSLGLLPLLALQTAALPFTAARHIQKPESMAKALGDAVRSEPRVANAVLMSEPDALMETLPFYVDNPVYFPRQREFDFRTYFDRGERRQKNLSLGELTGIADSVSCATGRPVLLSIGHRAFHFTDSGRYEGPYGSVFTWSPPDYRAFASRYRALRWFPGTTSDENYRTYVALPQPESCSIRQGR
jgi:hypothetical protein